jgi:hypothetical protein
MSILGKVSIWGLNKAVMAFLLGVSQLYVIIISSLRQVFGGGLFIVNVADVDPQTVAVNTPQNILFAPFYYPYGRRGIHLARSALGGFFTTAGVLLVPT